MSTELRIATRKSPLAMWQANHVAQLLRKIEPELDVTMVPSDTFADLDLTTTIANLGGKGAFSKEIQQVVLAGHADIAVHSAKDLQAITPEGLVVAAYPERGDSRDALIGISQEQLLSWDQPAPARIASGSNRRRTLLRDLCPAVEFVELRGNIATRLDCLQKEDGPDGLIMAAVALERLGLQPDQVEILDPDTFVPQVGQGSLAVEVATDNVAVRELVAGINHPVTALAVKAERSFLAELGGDCTLPAGAHAKVRATAAGEHDRPGQPAGQLEITVDGVLADEMCQNLQRMTEVGTVSGEPGRVLARSLRKQLEAGRS